MSFLEPCSQYAYQAIDTMAQFVPSTLKAAICPNTFSFFSSAADLISCERKIVLVGAITLISTVVAGCLAVRCCNSKKRTKAKIVQAHTEVNDHLRKMADDMIKSLGRTA